jgi:hypothetical protein
MSLLWTWALVAAVCAVIWAIARPIARRLDEAERLRSLGPWQRMCEALEAEELAGVIVTSPDATSSRSAAAAFGVHASGE